MEDRVVLAATVDGGELSWNLSHVSAGIKIVDPKAKEPLSGDLLFGESGHMIGCNQGSIVILCILLFLKITSSYIKRIYRVFFGI